MIIGNNIRLRPLEKDDLSRCVAWLNDPEVRENLIYYSPISMGFELAWYETKLNGPVEELPFIIEINTEEGWMPIGDTSFVSLNWRDRSVEIGIFIGNKQYWDHGYGTQVMRLMLHYGFNGLNLHRIYLHVFESNKRGIRAYEKAGFVLEGRLREARFKNGKYIDILIMSILHDEWDDHNLNVLK